MNFLDFEQPIAELEAKIEELRHVGNDKELNINEEISRLKKRSSELTESIFSSLSSWQVSQLSRHPQRPYTQDYIERIFTDFEELHGEMETLKLQAALICTFTATTAHVSTSATRRQSRITKPCLDWQIS